MKRYFTFYGATYYPNEAMDDFIGDFDTIDEAIEVIKKTNIEKDDVDWDYNWAVIYDSQNRKYVYECGNSSIKIE